MANRTDSSYEKLAVILELSALLWLIELILSVKKTRAVSIALANRTDPHSYI